MRRDFVTNACVDAGIGCCPKVAKPGQQSIFLIPGLLKEGFCLRIKGRRFRPVVQHGKPIRVSNLALLVRSQNNERNGLGFDSAQFRYADLPFAEKLEQ